MVCHSPSIPLHPPVRSLAQFLARLPFPLSRRIRRARATFSRPLALRRQPPHRPTSPRLHKFRDPPSLVPIHRRRPPRLKNQSRPPSRSPQLEPAPGTNLVPTRLHHEHRPRALQNAWLTIRLNPLQAQIPLRFARHFFQSDPDLALRSSPRFIPPFLPITATPWISHGQSRATRRSFGLLRPTQSHPFSTSFTSRRKKNSSESPRKPVSGA